MALLRPDPRPRMGAEQPQRQGPVEVLRLGGVDLDSAEVLGVATTGRIYRVMFMEHPLDDIDARVGRDTFDVVVRGVARCISAGRFDPADPAEPATQMWAVAHGLITLELAGLMPARHATAHLLATVENLYRAYGDDPRAAARSVAAARRAADCWADR